MSVAPAKAEMPYSPGSAIALRLAQLAVAAWVVTLAILVLTASNPVRLSTAQIRAADAVVTARWTSGFQVEIERGWSGPLKSGKVKVLNLGETGIQPGQSYLVPLSRFRKDWQVTVLGSQRQKPLVYPLTSEILEQLHRIPRPQSP